MSPARFVRTMSTQGIYFRALSSACYLKQICTKRNGVHETKEILNCAFEPNLNRTRPFVNRRGSTPLARCSQAAFLSEEHRNRHRRRVSRRLIEYRDSCTICAQHRKAFEGRCGTSAPCGCRGIDRGRPVATVQ